ncbi:Adenylate/guanylate cyclase domain-containing protein [Gammaproteobacteria bacterium]
MRARPFTHKKTLSFFIVLASLIAILTDYGMGTRIDYWLHDSAIVYQQRQNWKYTGIVVLDDDIPFRVTRIQALPLFAKAAERLIEQGAKGVYLDARVSKEIEGRMPYAVCLESDGEARWSQPTCGVDSTNSVCHVGNSEAGAAPLKMNVDAISRFKIAPYLLGKERSDLPDFLLYDYDAAQAIPLTGLVASDRLVLKSTPIARWLDMSEDHAIFHLAYLLAPERITRLYEKNRLDELCDGNKRCRRLRLSKPIYKVNTQNNQLILPLSQLASCDETIANKTAALLKNKLVILQASSPSESTDIIVTPMTTALFGPQLMTVGAQFLVDELETLLNQDFPQPPPQSVRILLFICAVLLSIGLGTYFSQILLWLGAIIVFLTLSALCFLNPITQLWPVTAVMIAYFIGAIQIIAVYLISGIQHGNLLFEYLPKQVIDVLMPFENPESFQPRHCKVVILMSDLEGYTTVTSLLKEPEYVMNLMNDYLTATSIILQDNYNGVLEGYVGDMVCYYWEYENSNEQNVYKQVLLSAIELASLQKKFFSSVSARYKEVLTHDVIEKISTIINAGIGITSGDMVKGNLGPKTGIKKFSILGDPINLASRIESLTRMFNTEIIIAGDFAKNAAAVENLVIRRLGAMQVKGRLKPEILYALGSKDDPRFASENINAWEQWITAIESGIRTETHCPVIYSKDQKTISDWLKKGVLDENGVWQLHNK